MQKQPSTNRIVPNVMFSFFIFNFPFFVVWPSLTSHCAAFVHALAWLQRAKEKSVLAVRCCTARQVAARYAKSGFAALNG
jgi:hypothetical protein